MRLQDTKSYVLHLILSESVGVFNWFPAIFLVEPNQVIGLCGQHELGGGPSHKIFTMYDDEARLITTSCGKISHQQETS
ncbi:hypothetical protein ACFX15_044838 [Malus domestica]